MHYDVAEFEYIRVFRDQPGKEGKREEGTYVRVLVNDEVQPLEFCGGSEGMCTLADFVESQGYARRSGDGDFEKCYN